MWSCMFAINTAPHPTLDLKDMYSRTYQSFY